MDGDMVIVTDDTFSEIVKKHSKIVIDCWAAWCGPCRMISPIVEELAREFKGKVVFGKLNVDENEKIPRKFNILGIPTLLFIKDGEHMDTMVGVVSKSQIIDRMDDVFRP